MLSLYQAIKENAFTTSNNQTTIIMNKNVATFVKAVIVNGTPSFEYVKITRGHKKNLVRGFAWSEAVSSILEIDAFAFDDKATFDKIESAVNAHGMTDLDSALSAVGSAHFEFEYEELNMSQIRGMKAAGILSQEWIDCYNENAAIDN